MPKKATDATAPETNQSTGAILETPTSPTAEELAVTLAGQELAAAKAALAEAVAKHAEATATHADAVKAAEPPLVLGKHVLVDFGGGTFVPRDAPPGYHGDAPDRVLLIDGQNVEHVAEVPVEGGVLWCYRKM